MWMRLLVRLLGGLGLAGSVLAEVVAVEVRRGARDHVEVLCEFAHAFEDARWRSRCRTLGFRCRLMTAGDHVCLPKPRDRSVFLELDVTGRRPSGRC